MILRRVIVHFRRQEWTAIFIDFLIVVLGVVLGIQVSNWNDALAARASEFAFLRAVSDDLRLEVEDTRGYIATLNDVIEWGARAGETLKAPESCTIDCWRRLVDFFLASQWVNVRADRAAYEEIRRTGLPRDRALKAELTRYYGLNDQVMTIFAELPQFREIVRSVIPAAVQDHFWRNCFRAEGRQQYFNENCPALLGDDEARAVIAALRANPATSTSLNYWMSTVSVVRITLETQVDEARKTLAVLDDYIETHE
jgi:hypothetical protein